MAELGCFALEFDGLTWTVADGRRMRVLDTQRALNEVLWQVNDLPGQVVALSAEPALEQVALATSPGEVELWRYQLPSRRLVARGEALPDVPSQEGVRALDPAGGGCVVWPVCGSDMVWRLAHLTSSIAGQAPILTPLPDIAAARLSVQVEAGAGWLMAGVADGAQVHWRLLTPGHAAVHAAMAWPQAALQRARLQAQHVLVFDGHGRLWHLDTATSVMRGLSLR